MQAYKKIFVLSVLLTVILFAMDKDEYTFTMPSIVGYIIVGAMYTGAIFFLASGLYYTASLVNKLIRRH